MKVLVKDLHYADSGINDLLWYVSKLSKNEELVFDFSQFRYLRPDVVILLISVCKMWHEKTDSAVRWKGLHSRVMYYLDCINIRSVEFIQVENRPFTKFAGQLKEKRIYQNIIPLQIIREPSQLTAIIKDTTEKMTQWFPERVQDGFLLDVKNIVMEVVGNSLEHSVADPENERPTCYFTAQKYQTEGKPAKVILALGDLGIGIAGSLGRGRRPFGTDAAAIRKALFDGWSSREGFGGLGLQTVSAAVRKSGGQITIRSGTGSVRYIPQRNIKSDQTYRHSLIGTQTSLIL